uniref:Uncharacterized protein n=2 Tax=Macaca TaxID=9539 RepID=A0A5F7ZUK3_MACMU
MNIPPSSPSTTLLAGVLRCSPLQYRVLNLVSHWLLICSGFRSVLMCDSQLVGLLCPGRIIVTALKGSDPQFAEGL